MCRYIYICIYLFINCFLFIYLFIYNYIYIVLISLVTAEILNSFRTFALAAARASGCQEQKKWWDIFGTQSTQYKPRCPKIIVNAQLVHNISQRSEMIDVYGYIEHNRTISPGYHFFMEVQIGTIWMALQKGIKKGVQELQYFWGTPIYGWFILWNIL